MEPSSGRFDVGGFAGELAQPTGRVGTRLLFENDRVRVWEIRLGPGERAPFHRHVHPYLFVCVDAGRARSRFPDGTMIDLDYDVGSTGWFEPSEERPEVHDLENVGESVLRFTTVELL